jgi:hypothetical protein
LYLNPGILLVQARTTYHDDLGIVHIENRQMIGKVDSEKHALWRELDWNVPHLVEERRCSGAMRCPGLDKQNARIEEQAFGPEHQCHCTSLPEGSYPRIFC